MGGRVCSQPISAECYDEKDRPAGSKCARAPVCVQCSCPEASRQAETPASSLRRPFHDGKRTLEFPLRPRNPAGGPCAGPNGKGLAPRQGEAV
jgi:hypothetical protein